MSPKTDKAIEAQPEAPPEDVGELIKQMTVAAVASSAAASEDTPATNVELTNKVADLLFNSENRKLLGVLSKHQISGIKKLFMINDIFFRNKPSVISRIINNEIDLSVSENGLGRDQLVKLTKVEDPMEPAMKGIRRYIQ